MYVKDSFVGRTSILAALDSHLATVRSTGRGEMVAVRGRRQVGKSAVVERFVERAKTPYAFVTAINQGTLQQQWQAFKDAITEARVPVPTDDAWADVTPGNWRGALLPFTIAAQTAPVILVLDEFPWMAQADPSLEGQLQAMWDRTLEKLPILVILIGSDVSVMEQLSTYGRPLFGRIRELVVAPLDLGEVAAALPHQRPAEIIDSYLVVGGFPRLVRDLATTGLAAEDYVRQALADPFSPLVTTGRLILDAEFPDAAAARRVLSAIGSEDTGAVRFSELIAGSGTNGTSAAQTATTRALAVLSGAKKLIDVEQPAWSPPTSRLRRYRVADPYLRFWFRYAKSAPDLAGRGRPDIPIGHFDRDWVSWRGRSVEPLVRSALLRIATTDDAWEGVENVLPWWTRDGQVEVDVVAMTRELSVAVGTIKWRATSGVTAKDMTNLAVQAAQVPRAQDAQLIAIGRQGTCPPGAVRMFTAEDLVRAWTDPAP